MMIAPPSGQLSSTSAAREFIAALDALEAIAALPASPAPTTKYQDLALINSIPAGCAAPAVDGELVEALRTLVSACEEVFCSKETEEGGKGFAPCEDQDTVSSGADGEDDDRLTFGMIRNARAALSRLSSDNRAADLHHPQSDQRSVVSGGVQGAALLEHLEVIGEFIDDMDHLELADDSTVDVTEACEAFNALEAFLKGALAAAPVPHTPAATPLSDKEGGGA
jgi:hypothetical protein